MTVEEVQEWIKAIENKIHDDEIAHAKEDNLYYEVLKAISKGAFNAQELAAEAIKTKELDFARYTS